MQQEELERYAKEFETQQEKTEQPIEPVFESAETLPAIKEEAHKIAEKSSISEGVGFTSVVGGVQQDILERAQKKISSEKIVDKHAESLKNIADKALEVQAEQASLQVQQQEANNKVRKQEIKNQLIVLKAEAQRLEKEQRQLNKEQKAEHKRRNKEAKWEIYKDKLTKMKYTYVPNAFVLWMLLFWDGVRGFFEGLATVNRSLAKAFRWLLIIIAVLIVLSIVLFSIPVTRDWILNILSGGK